MTIEQTLSGGEPLSEELEAKLHEAWNRILAWRMGGDVYGEPSLDAILRAFAREILQNAEFEKGCECDSCCRLEELRVKVHLPDGSADEIAGSIGHILDGQLESLQELWPLQDQLLASQESCRSLAEALEKAMPTLKSCEAPEVSFDGDMTFWRERRARAIRDGDAALEMYYGGVVRAGSGVEGTTQGQEKP